MAFKRVWCVLILTAVIISSFLVLPASAENSSPDIWAQFNNSLMPDGSMMVPANGTFDSSTKNWTFNLQKVYVYNYFWRKGDRLTVTLNFRPLNNFAWLKASNEINATPVGVHVPQFKFVSSYSGWTITSGFKINHMYVNPKGLTFTVECTSNSYSGNVVVTPDNISASYSFDGTSSSGQPIAALNAFSLEIESKWANNHYYNNVQGIYDTLFYMAGQVDDLSDAFIYFNRKISTITYDENGNAVINQEDQLSWVDAILQLLQSINAPLIQQVQMENKAKEAGADDALDNAYDSVGSSFGSLGEFSGLGSLGSFDGDSLGEAGNDGLLAWFSKRNQDAIDAVPQSRYPDDIIDFYTGKIESYREGVNSDDSADR